MNIKTTITKLVSKEVRRLTRELEHTQQELINKENQLRLLVAKNIELQLALTKRGDTHWLPPSPLDESGIPT
jgi:hypothetical protein